MKKYIIVNVCIHVYQLTCKTKEDMMELEAYDNKQMIFEKCACNIAVVVVLISTQIYSYFTKNILPILIKFSCNKKTAHICQMQLFLIFGFYIKSLSV